MRVTTKVIERNTLSNINTNKVLQDKLSNQMGTQKKINRPSEDPIVAIRALRLRSNVSQVTQFYERNIPDANSWLEITEDALESVSDVVTDMIRECQKGSSEKLTQSDRQAILDAISSLRDEVYATGNSDYAGRCIFTGYRTDTTLKFTKPETKNYSITEQVQLDKFDSVKYIEMNGLDELTEANYDGAALSGLVETDIKEYDIHRLRLAYSNVDDTTGGISLSYMDGTTENSIGSIASMDKAAAYDAISQANDAGTEVAVYIPETGEILMSDAYYENQVETHDGQEFRVQYNKSQWVKDDLRPEHYFACTDMTDADPANHIAYNQEYLTEAEREKQVIEYDVGLNQVIRVNTTADEVFAHDIGRDVDDLVDVMNELDELEQRIATLNDLAEKNANDPTAMATINSQLEAANKAQVYLNEKRQKLFEHSITKMQEHLDNVNYAITNCGTRSKKLELIENRLMSQKTTFETLASDNEDVDLAEVAVQLSSAEMTYNAALMATGKVLQTTLVNYL